MLIDLRQFDQIEKNELCVMWSNFVLPMQFPSPSVTAFYKREEEMKLFSIATLLFATLLGFNAYAGGKAHHVVYHVDQNDPKAMNLTLNNIQNMRKYYKDKGEEVTIELVANGPGILMFNEDSPVKARIETMSLEASNLTFSGCAVSTHKIGKKRGKELKLLGEVTSTPSGVVRISELQEEGYSYIRP